MDWLDVVLIELIELIESSGVGWEYVNMELWNISIH
jgi:hypothetical protein